ncbi:importin beta-5 subunit [Xylona heveae TC161]|uniref:Importin beta-5 subunit n=1 Tax=Xylona heveae (strain CBS 132557 / TC161) TaxID=1328760 RepID=A0A164ZQ00_XYLHT|nr:importin beta-5 subunit [Xylona heveae TC161]KZF19359.1 importin beta-5 subunit [Xylona heveae TC161]
MEQQLLNLLAETQLPAEAPRKQAEFQLEQLYPSEAFPKALVSVASHTSVPLNLRQSALLTLKTFVTSSWSPIFEEFKGLILISDANKQHLRTALLELATSEDSDRKVKTAASYVVSKIASADFPDQWPDLLPRLLALIPVSTDSQLHGALRVLADLVEDGLNEDQFFAVARDLVQVIFDVASNDSRKTILRAMAVSIFRSSFDMLEMVMEDHKAEVKAFAEEALHAWSPFFLDIMRKPLPTMPSEEEEHKEDGTQAEWRGLIALKLQVVKTFMKIRTLFPGLLSPQSPVVFSVTWQELSSLQAPYHEMYIENERQGRLEDADGLPYTLDFLVLEELDFMQACLRAPPVRQELETQLQNHSATQEGSWLVEVMKLAVAYAQITTEEEGLWDIDVNVFLSEETSVTANYTPRTACGDLIIKLGEWLKSLAIEGLLAYTRTLFQSTAGWKLKEAALYILNQLLGDFSDVEQKINPELAHGYTEFVKFAMRQEDFFLRARGFLVAGSLTRTGGETLHQVAAGFMEESLRAISDDSAEVVQVSCIRALQDYLQSLPASITQPMQGPIASAISNFLASKDLDDFAESDDLMVTLVETLRDVIMLDTRICVAQGSTALELLFTIASHGANNFQLTMLVNETFEDIAGAMSALGREAYTGLCEKVLPSLTGAFDVGNLTEESALTNLAAELLAILAEHGPEPLPQGFVGTVMPKLNRLLISSDDAELLRPATDAVQHMIDHDPKQFFEWQDPESGKLGLEVALVIVDRLLNPSVDDNAAAEVGGLAAELVEKAGADKLGPYLPQLLQAVTVRLSTATQAQFIQSLILVFARLSLVSAKDVVDFLAQLQVGSGSGLQIVMSKWLENSVNFAGYDEIRQNVIALSRLYSLNDHRLSQTMVQGDLIIPKSDRIMTRSKARLNPDQYTVVSVPLKILKLLVEELSSASGNTPRAIDPALAAELAEEGSDDGDWEDVPNALDLSSMATRQDLMAYADSPSFRQRDDETQAYLLAFFQEEASKPGFQEMFGALTTEEQEKLRTLGGQ